jgi:hypothetical protein
MIWEVTAILVVVSIVAGLSWLSLDVWPAPKTVLSSDDAKPIGLLMDAVKTMVPVLTGAIALFGAAIGKLYQGAGESALFAGHVALALGFVSLSR